MRYAELREKHLADVTEALEEIDAERARLLALMAVYQNGDSSNGSSGANGSGSKTTEHAASHNMHAPIIQHQKLKKRGGSETMRERKKRAVLQTLTAIYPAAMKDRDIAQRVRAAGIQYPRDPNRPNRSGLDFELYALRDEGLIERTAPATWRLKKNEAQAGT